MGSEMSATNRSHNQIDPVCQMKVSLDSDVKPVVWESKVYHFCAEPCRQAFVTDPGKYLKSKPAKRKGWWGRYLERLNKVTGGKPPCCH